jgi:hypothetical protein
MKWTGAALAAFITLAAGCGGTVVVPSQSSDSSSGSGNGGAGSSSSGAGGSFTVSTSTGTQPGFCNDATVFFDIVGDGANQHFDASCSPEGHLSFPGGAKTPKGPPTTLVLTPCSTSNSVVLSIAAESDAWPTNVSDVTFTYYHEGAEYDVSLPQSNALEVFTFESVGGVIEGAFTTTVTSKDPAGTPGKIQITGKFRVCRGPDLIPV